LCKILEICKERDLPFLKHEWEHLRDNRETEEDAIKAYLSRMRLASFKDITFKDSNYTTDEGMNNVTREPKELIREYIHTISIMEEMVDGGVFALYGMEQYRIELHDMICETFNIDRTKSKELLNYLDEKLNFSFNDLNDDILEEYTEKLYNYLLLHKDEYKIGVNYNAD